MKIRYLVISAVICGGLGAFRLYFERHPRALAKSTVQEGAMAQRQQTADALTRSAELIKLGHFREAEASLRSIIQADPSNGTGHMLLADALLKQSRLKESIVERKLVFQHYGGRSLYADSRPFYEFETYRLEQTAGSSGDEVLLDFVLANGPNMEDNDGYPVIPRTGVDRAHKEALAYVMLGAAQIFTSPRQAHQHFVEALRRVPDMPLCLAYLGYAQLGDEDYEGARKTWTYLLRKPGLPEDVRTFATYWLGNLPKPSTVKRLKQKNPESSASQ